MRKTSPLGLSDGNLHEKANIPVNSAVVGQPFEFLWTIEKWADLEEDPNSPSFLIDGLSFHMRAVRPNAVSQFLVVKVYLDSPTSSPRTFLFSLSLVNSDPDKSVNKRKSKAYSKMGSYETYTFVSGKSLNPHDGFLTNGSITIRFSYIVPSIRKSRQHSTAVEPPPLPVQHVQSSIMLSASAQPRQAIYPGLKNQGATCYLNSLLQFLFHLPAFRRIVYNMPTTGAEDITTSIPLNMQRLFCRMQFSTQACSTTDLTRSFGWVASDVATQHDIQEFSRVLLENIEEKLQNTDLASHIAQLFRGRWRNTVKCRNVPYEKVYYEDFYDLPLVVKGCPTLASSFEKELQKEELYGANQYDADSYGKQDADMYSQFFELPPVLMIQLRRFERDILHNCNCKVNDKFNFPPEIDLSPYMCPDADHSKNYNYELYSVFVHSGLANAGHYYAFLRTSTDGQWYKFNDTSVTKVTAYEAIEQNYGDAIKGVSGYMLVYVRKEDAALVFEPVHDEEVPQHLKDQMQQSEQIKIKGVKNAIEIKLSNENTIRLNTLKWTTGFENRLSTQILNVPFDETFEGLYKKASQSLGKKIGTFRLWKCAAFSVPDDAIPFTDAKLSTFGLNTLNVFAQDIEEGDVIVPPSTDRILFIKFFVPDEHSAVIQYLYSTTMSMNDQLSALFPRVNKFVNLPDDTLLIVFQETITRIAQHVNSNLTLQEAGIETGTILILQVSPGAEGSPVPTFDHVIKPLTKSVNETTTSVLYTDVYPDRTPWTVDQYMEHHLHSIDVDLFDASSDSQALTINFPSSLRWPALKQFIADALKLDYDPLRDSIRLYKRDSQTGKSAKQPINTRFATSMRTVFNSASSGVKPQITFSFHPKIPESAISSMMTIRVQYSENSVTIDSLEKLMVHKGSTPSEIGREMQNRGIMPQCDFIRALAVLNGKIVGRPPLDEPFTPQTDQTILRLEVVPEDERDPKDDDKLVAVSRGFVDRFNVPRLVPEPFLFLVHNGQRRADIWDEILTWGLIKQEDCTGLMVVKRDKIAHQIEDDEIICDLITNGVYLLLCLRTLEGPPQPSNSAPSECLRPIEKGVKLVN